MGNDIRALLSVLSGDLSSTSSNLYAALIAAAFFLYLGQVLMLIVILRKKIQPDDNELKEGSAKSELEMGKQN
jgi:hypothetical protein